MLLLIMSRWHISEKENGIFMANWGIEENCGSSSNQKICLLGEQYSSGWEALTVNSDVSDPGQKNDLRCLLKIN